MRILLINKYLFPRGGDAISTLSTGRLLKEKGHEVFYWGMKHPLNPQYLYDEYFVNFVDYNKKMSLKEKMIVSLNIIYSLEAKIKIKKVVEIIKPDIVHLNNFAHQISPSILDVFAKYKIPTVMTIRDYKLICPSYKMLSNGHLCERCKSGKYIFCLLNKCQRKSYFKSLINTIEMYLHHKLLHIYDKIDIFIATSKFLKQKHLEMGFNKNIVVLPNFIEIGDFSPQFKWEEDSLVYFGRLAEEKGLLTLLKAVKELKIKLKIIGDGPFKDILKKEVEEKQMNNVVFKGHLLGEELKNEIKSSMATVIPSEWYETFGRTIIESFALGKPVIGSRIGGIPELIKDGENGYTFEPFNVEDLKEKILLLQKNSGIIEKLGRNARKFVEENFNSEKHYEELMKIYSMAIEEDK